MKIAVIAKTRLPIAEPFRGGLEAFTYTICKEYIRQGHDITLYSHADSNPELNIKSFYGNEHREDQYFETYETDEYLSIIKDIEQNGYDVVHNNSTHELPIIWGAKAAIPVVTTLHTPLLANLSKMIAAISVASSSSNLHFVFVSNALQKMWQSYTVNGSNVIHNGVDMNKWALVRQSSQYLLWFGRIVESKGLDIALDAAHEVGMPLHFAGSIDDKSFYDEEIKPRITADDTYLGHLKQMDILAEMHNAAAMINAVRWEEPFGLFNIEAMSAGVPIAGFDRGAFREIINESSGVIAKSTDVVSLAEAIKLAIPLESKQVREQAKQFSVSKMVENYLQYFETIL